MNHGISWFSTEICAGAVISAPSAELPLLISLLESQITSCIRDVGLEEGDYID
jgi:hypothetical protein